MLSGHTDICLCHRIVSVVNVRCFPSESLLTVQSIFNLTELGAQLESGIFVSRIILGSACAREGNLAVGDRVVSVSITYVAVYH